MKKRWVGLGLALTIICTSMSAFAQNNVDTELPNKKVAFAYSTAADTALRRKEDSTSHYIKNTSGFDLWVVSKNSAGVNRTYKNHAIIPTTKEWSIYNSVFESGDQYCKLSITSAKSGVSGYVKGVWSPDCYGYVSPANP
mgnify:FL=1